MILDGRRLSEGEETKRFRAHFGISFLVMSELWSLLNPYEQISKRAQAKHLLWTLVYLKVYQTEAIHCTIVKCKTRETFRNWVRKFTTAIRELEPQVIQFENRWNLWDGITPCLITVDGTDVQINEPTPYNPIWFSHKFNGPGIKYEVGCCIKTGDIVWFRGPFPCAMHDRTIFDLYLSKELVENECVEADSGYSGRGQIKTPGMGTTSKDRREKSHARARHENTNQLLKVFGVMKKWRNPEPHTHEVVAHAVAVMVQLSIALGEKLYDIDYSVNYI